MTEHCLWIGDEQTDAPYVYTCTCKPVQGQSYCVQHLAQVYQAGTAVRRKKDARRAAAVWDLESEFNAAVEELIEEGYDFSEERWITEVEEV